VVHGQRLDAMDADGNWFEAIARDVRGPPAEALVHYVGWPDGWDEWVPADESRLGPLHTMTDPDGGSLGPDGLQDELVAGMVRRRDSTHQ
jgi:hypothetical protein